MARIWRKTSTRRMKNPVHAGRAYEMALLLAWLGDSYPLWTRSCGSGSSRFYSMAPYMAFPVCWQPILMGLALGIIVDSTTSGLFPVTGGSLIPCFKTGAAPGVPLMTVVLLPMIPWIVTGLLEQGLRGAHTVFSCQGVPRLCYPSGADVLLWCLFPGGGETGPGQQTCQCLRGRDLYLEHGGLYRGCHLHGHVPDSTGP